ncbi:3-oxoacyl-[ACP] reductase [Enterobacter hormaechei]|nr:3-oxoacyl-[ACP] reductase [Enterobacter hormaechei]
MRSVLVTGASKGIGRAIALQLAADGFTVGVHYHRDEAGAQETLEAIVQAGGAGRFTHLRRGQPRAVPHGAGTGDR